jgi:phage replication-related protein YjqB (UPF0714/DUF867 family)
MADRYTNFADLAAKERLGTDYRIWLEDRGTPVIVIAPHGGCIEPGTSAIAKAIAREDLSIYVFEGIGRRTHGDLHIASHLFDEPKGVQVVTSAETTIAIHGRKDAGDPKTVSIGGRNSVLGSAIASSLRDAGFQTGSAGHGLAARDASNICNRGSSGAGVQLELPRSLRDQLANDEAKLRSFSDAVRNAISS